MSKSKLQLVYPDQVLTMEMEIFKLRVKLWAICLIAPILSFGGVVVHSSYPKLSWLMPPAGVVSSIYGLSVLRKLEREQELLNALPDYCVASRSQRFKEFLAPGNVLASEVLDPTSGTETELELYNWENLHHEACGVIIVGNAGSAKTSLACWLAGKLTEHQAATVIVCDPHFNDTWKELGLNPIGQIPDIETALENLCGELDDRCLRKEKGEPIGAPYILIMDEMGACRERFSDYKKVEKSLKRLGSEGRKFDMILIAIGHSKNVEDMGISAPLRSNFILALCGASARDEAKRNWAGKEPENVAIRDWIKQQPYPIVLSGAIETQLANHPTHGHHKQWKKKGNKPANLLPINQIESSDVVTHTHTHTPTHTYTDRETLERLWNIEPTHPHDTPKPGIIPEFATPTPTPTRCSFCGSEDTISHGKTASGTPRKKCKNCGKVFTV